MAIDFYQDFQRAYDFYNEKLFDGELQDSLIVFQRKTRTFGYISYDRHSVVGGSSYMHELALNPDYFAYRTIIETLSTLVHEQCHLYQHQLGTETRKTYHNQAFCDLMFERGLQTSHTGEDGGKKVGQNMSHYIIPDGKFLEVTLEFLRETSFKSFYDRYTPKYIEPYNFYNRSIKFISNMQGRVRVEDVIPPYLLEYFQENPHILQGEDPVEPILKVENNPDDEEPIGIEDPDDTKDPDEIKEPDQPPSTPVEEPEPDSSTTEGGSDDQEIEVDIEQSGTEPIAIDTTSAVQVAEPVETLALPAKVEVIQTGKKVSVTDIVSRISTPEQLLEPIQSLIEKRVSAVQTQANISELKKTKGNKCKFTCEGCKSNLWGKDSLNVICADCDMPYQLVG